MRSKIRKRSRDEWLARALEVLAAEGVNGVRVERLARDLKISKSGFYWHFKDRRDLLKQLLDYWRHEYTQIVSQNQDLLKVDPETRLYKVVQMIPEHSLTNYEVTMRAWAEHDTMAAEAVASVYKERMNYIRKAFKELGFTGNDLEMRTRLFVCYHTWEKAMFGNDSARKLNRLRKPRLTLLLKK